MSQSLAHIREKLKRADEHIVQLDRECEVFLDEAPNRVLVDYDSESAESFIDFHRNRPIPPRLSVITGELIYQFRSVLDHLACALIVRDGGSPSIKSQFPIFIFEPTEKDDLRRYEGQVKGITRPAVLAAIKGLQPYTRGSGRHSHWLGILKAFSNTDKHRALVLHVINVEPRIDIHLVLPDAGFEFETDRSDDGTITSATLFPNETVEVVTMQRRLATDVTFTKWGDSGHDIGVVDGLRGLLKGIVGVVQQFAPFVE